jgi:primosomal protein N' (replication factor Y)
VGVGTKAVESKIRESFAEAKVVRIDRDSAKPDEYQAILDDLQKGKIDIVIGTQILGRGLDVAGLELVGIINADYDLLASDFNSSERAFQQISQTAGRAGRRDRQGEVIIQTTLVTHELLGFITKFDYEGFYQAELSKRKKYSYPPFSYLLKLECGFVNQNLGQTKCNELLKKLESNKDFEVLGPAKSHPFTKNGKHYWKLVVKSKSRQKLVELAKTLDANWIINLDPYGIT